MRPLWFSTAVFISRVRILPRRSCFLASTVFHESIFLQDFILFVVMSTELWCTKSRRYHDERRKVDTSADREVGSKISIAMEIRSSGQRRKPLKPHREVSSVYFFNMTTSLYALFV